MSTTSSEISPQQQQSVLGALRSPRRLRTEVLAGLVVALALIPEAISFSIIAGVDPRVGLFASFTMAVTIAIVGGRPAMISAATGAVALVIAPLVASHGLDYLIAAVILAGLLQLVLGGLGVAKVMRFVPRSVMVGFVNALAILIFLSQVPHLLGVPWLVYPMVAVGILVIVALPKLTTAIPSPLVAIIVLTCLSLWLGSPVNTVSDMGELPQGLPFFMLPDVPLTCETLAIIAPYSLTMAAVGLLESLLTAQIVDDMTHTGSDKQRECGGQGVANIVAALFGGMGGCAMIGQSVINVTSGGRGRLSTFTAGLALLIMLVLLGGIVGQVPMPALVAIMIMVSIGTFSWNSIPNLRVHPWQSSMVMFVTVAVVVATHNLAIGVLVGVLLSGIFFVQKVMHMFEVERTKEGDTVTYTAHGEIFFGSVARFEAALGPESLQPDPADHVIIDVTRAHFWDISAIGALDKVVERMRMHGRSVQVVGLNEASADLVDRHGVTDRTGVEIGLAPHP